MNGKLSEIDMLVVVLSVCAALYVGFWVCMAGGFELAVASVVESPTDRLGLALGLALFVSGPFAACAVGVGLIYYGSRLIPGAMPLIGAQDESNPNSSSTVTEADIA